MAEERVRQLVAFQLDRIEARNQRMQLLHEQKLREQRLREQEYFLLYQNGDDGLGIYDENQNNGRISGTVTPVCVTPRRLLSPLGSSQFLSPRSSRDNLLSPGGVCSYEELHGSLPNMGHDRPASDVYSMYHSSMPAGLHQMPAESPEDLEVPSEGSPEDIASQSQHKEDRMNAKTPSPPQHVFQRSRAVRRSRSLSEKEASNRENSEPRTGVFQRNHGIRQSKSFNDKISNGRHAVKQPHPGEFQRNTTLRRSNSVNDDSSTDHRTLMDLPPGEFQRNHSVRRSRSFDDKLSEVHHSPKVPPGGSFQRNQGIRRSRSFTDNLSKNDDIANLPEAIFHRNQGIRRSRSFNELLNRREKIDSDSPPGDHRRVVTRRHSIYSSGAMIGQSLGHVTGHLSPLPPDLRGEMLSPPPMDYRPFSPSSMSLPLSPWSSVSNVSSVWHNSKIEEEVRDEDKKTTVLAKQKTFNENCCMRCFSRFIFLLNQKVQCYECKYFICKTCGDYDSNRREYVCNVCKKQGELSTQSLGWFYENVKNKFKRFGSAKVVRSLYKRKTDSDSEAEVHYEPPLYSTEPVGRRTRGSVQGLFEIDVDNMNIDLSKEPNCETVEDIVAAEKTAKSYSNPYSCSVSTGRETFEHFKDKELNAYNSQLKIVLREIDRTLERHSPTPGHMHQQERDLLKDQQFQLASILSDLSQSLHIAVDNQDPSESPASPVARHQLIKDILVKEVEQFTKTPVTLSSITRDGPQSYEEQLANIILNKVVDDFHQRALQQAKDEESDVRRSFTKLSNKITVEQIQDRYISECDTDVTSSQVDDFTSDAESRLAEVTELSLAKVQIDGDIIQNKDSVNARYNQAGLELKENSILSPRDSDSGIVSSPTAEKFSVFRRNTSEESDEPMPSPRQSDHAQEQEQSQDYAESGMIISTSEPTVEKLRTVIEDNNNVVTKGLPNGSVPSKQCQSDSHGDVIMSKNQDKPMLDKHFDEQMMGNDQQWDVVMNSAAPGGRSRTRPERSWNISNIKAPVVADDELDSIMKNNMINEEWSLVESRHSHVMSDEENDDQQMKKLSSSLSSSEDPFHPHNNVFSSTTNNTGQKLSELKQSFTKSKAIPISRQVHHEDVESQSDSDVTIGDDKSSPEGTPVMEPRIHKNLVIREKIDPFDSDEQDDLEDAEVDRSHIPLPSFLNSGRLAFESGDLDDISSVQATEEEDTMSTFSTEISFGKTWNFSGTESLFRDRGKISAYDNFGEKKVGRDIQGPVIMLVPNGKEDTTNIKVGDRDVDDLSDLSENETRSDISSLDSDSQDENDVSEVKAAMKQVLRRSSKTKLNNQSNTQSQSPLSGAPDAKNIEYVAVETAPVQKVKVIPSAITEESLLAMELVNIESENQDPKFVIPPADVIVLEGDVAKFSCKAAGTDPLDVFWHKEGLDLVQLNDHESCDVRYDGDMYYLDMFNTTLADQSQILCIAVNDDGRCVQGVRLFVQENPGQKKAPEFLKSLNDAEVKVGSRVKFRVKLSGYPLPKVTWFKDGKRLTRSLQHRIEKQGNRDYLLCLDYTTLDDDAEYSVIAKNIIGEARSSAQLVVEDQDSDGEISSVTSSQVSLPLSPPPTAAPPVSEELRGLYPDTEELLKLAEKVSQTRGDITTTASKMLRSAGQMSTLHQQMDEMDKKLNNMEHEVKDTDHIAMETQAYKEIYRDELLQEHQEMQTSAYALRNVTSKALDILQSADDIVQASKDSQSLKRKSDIISPISLRPEPEVELKLTFVQFDKLWSAGKITKAQISAGKVPESVFEDCIDYLRKETNYEPEMDQSHDLVADDLQTSIDCGLKRVDSKRYKRDYVINKDSPKALTKKWEVKVLPAPQSTSSGGKVASQEVDIVKSTPAGTREVAHNQINVAEQQIDSQSENGLQFYDQQADSPLARYPNRDLPPIAEINQVEDEIYLAAGRVNHLHDKIEHLEDRVHEADDQDMADLENQVIRAAVQVKTNEQQVSLVEQHVRSLQSQTKEAEERPEDTWRHLLSPVRDRPPSSFGSFESHSKMPHRWNSTSEHLEVTTEADVKPMSPTTTRSPQHLQPLSPVKIQPPVQNLSPVRSSVQNMSPVRSPVQSMSPVRSPIQSMSPVRSPVQSMSPVRSPVQNMSPVRSPVESMSPVRNLPSVQPLSPVQSPLAYASKPRPQSINLHGDSSEDVLPESRTEFEDSIGLPSVKSLMSKFNQRSPADDENKKGGANVKRVYSLTGRDLPKTVREKLKEQTQVKASNPNIRSSETKRPLTALFEDRRPEASGTQPSSVVTNQKTRSSSLSSKAPWRDASPNSNESQSPNQPRVSVASPTKTTVATSMYQQQPNIDEQVQAMAPTYHRTPTTPTYNKTPTSPTNPTMPINLQKQPLERRKSSTIMARAKFWDSRINEEVVTDTQANVEQFPDMPADNFKSTENLQYSS